MAAISSSILPETEITQSLRGQMVLRTLSLICTVALLTLARPAAAQEGPTREGFWWGFGLGYGWVHVGCDICDSDRSTSISGLGRAGGTINSRVLLGAEANGWTRSEDEVDEYLGSITVVAYWYTRPGGNFHLKTGFGYAAYRIDDGENALTSSGFGPQIGAGYEFRLARSLSLAPYLNALITLPTGKIYLNGDQQADDVSLGLIQLGLGVTWH